MKNIHDKFVKASFSDPGRAISFFEKFLPEKIVDSLDMKTLQCLQESYLSDDLKAGFSDMVFEVKEKSTPYHALDIVLLFEHKSSPDRHVLLQVGLYMFSHWWKCIREKKPLKPIIPIIYYQGKKRWKVKSTAQVFDTLSGNLFSFIPEIRHVFIALHSLSDVEIAALRDRMMAAAVMAQKKAFDVMKLAEDLEKIFRLFPVKREDGNFLKTIFVYLYKVSEIPKSEWEKAIKTAPSDLKENLMTTYSWMKEEGKQEGRLEGRLEGEKIGIHKKEIEVILALFDDKISVQSIARYTKLSEEDVTKILKENHKIID